MLLHSQLLRFQMGCTQQLLGTAGAMLVHLVMIVHYRYVLGPLLSTAFETCLLQQ